MKINIEIFGKTFTAELSNTETGKAIYDSLPISAFANVWGNEIYFSIPTTAKLEPSAVTELNIGDLAYYPPMKAFCIFFGPTPASKSDKPEAAGLVNVFGKIIDIDVEELAIIPDGANVLVTKA